jgi:hypothetical protein
VENNMVEDDREEGATALPPLLLSVSETARITNSGESTIWGKLAEGLLEAVKDGARTKVKYSSVERHYGALPAAKFLPPKPRRSAQRDDVLPRRRPRRTASAPR